MHLRRSERAQLVGERWQSRALGVKYDGFIRLVWRELSTREVAAFTAFFFAPHPVATLKEKEKSERHSFTGETAGVWRRGGREGRAARTQSGCLITFFSSAWVPSHYEKIKLERTIIGRRQREARVGDRGVGRGEIKPY